MIYILLGYILSVGYVLFLASLNVTKTSFITILTLGFVCLFELWVLFSFLTWFFGAFFKLTVISVHGFLSLLLCFSAVPKQNGATSLLQDSGFKVCVTVEIFPHLPLPVCSRREAASMPQCKGSTEDGLSEMTAEIYFIMLVLSYKDSLDQTKLH